MYFPGTFVHEASHALASVLLFVPVKHISFLPKLEADGLKLGSVSIAHTDPLRRFIIGVAPVIIGVSLIIATFYFTAKSNLLNNYWLILILVFIVFEIANTMFSSKKDMEGTLKLALAITLMGTILYLFGARIPISIIESFFKQAIIIAIFKKITIYLLFPLVADTVLIFFFKLFSK